MFSFKKSFAAIGAISLLVVAVAALLQPAGAASSDKGSRKFYLTKTGHVGNEALTACAGGYHMASVWEISDPSNLRYDTEFGATLADSGFGPPSGETLTTGWIRTGSRASLSSPSGTANCNAWTVGTNIGLGSTAWFTNTWNNFPASLRTDAAECGSAVHVWCVQD